MNSVKRKQRKLTAWILSSICFCSALLGSMIYRNTEVCVKAAETLSTDEVFYQTQLKDMLGRAKGFGVFAQTLHIKSDFESNFAVNIFDGNEQGVGNTAGTYTNTGGICYVGEEIQSTMKARSPIDQIILGFSVTKQGNHYYNSNNERVINADNSPNVKVLEKKDYLDVTGVKNGINQEFMGKKAEKDSAGVKYRYDDQKIISIDVQKCKESVCYVSMSAEQLNSLETDKLEILKNNGQIVIVNVTDCNRDITFRQYRINGKTTVQPDITMTDSVYWNFTGCTKKITLSGICGVVVAPEASVSIAATVSGRIIAAQVENPGGELHFIATDLKSSIDEGEVYLNKYAVENDDGTWTLNMEVYQTETICTINNMITNKEKIKQDAVLKDFVADSFVFAGSQADVKAYTYSCTGKNLGELTWETQGTDITNSLEIKVTGNALEVRGYDYQKNVVTVEDEAKGAKLVVSVNIQRNPVTYGGNGIPTNTGESGIYDEDGTPIEKFPIPEVNVPILYGITSQNQSIYLTEDTNTSNLAELAAVTKDMYERPVNVRGIPDGVNNRYVDIEYQVKDVDGKVVHTENIEAGTTLGHSPYDFPLEFLKDNTEYYFSAKVTANKTAVQGFTPAADVECKAKGTIYVFKPVLSFDDTVIFLGDNTDLNDRIKSVEWKCSDVSAKKPEHEAPALKYEYAQMEKKENQVLINPISSQGDDANSVTVSPEKALNVQLTEVYGNGRAIKQYSVLNPSVCSSMEQDHMEGRLFTIHVVTGQLQINKTIDRVYTNIQQIHSNETFVYKIQQYSVREDGSKGELAAVFYQTLGFDANADKKSASAVISGLKRGYYTVTEETQASLKYRLSRKADNYGNPEEKAGTELYIGRIIGTNQDMEYERAEYYGLEQKTSYETAAVGNPAVVDYENVWNDWSILSDSAVAVNRFIK